MKIIGQNFRDVKILSPKTAGLRHVLKQSVLFDGQLDLLMKISLPQNDEIVASLFKRNGAGNNGKHFTT